jgi:hypothetical protein
MVHERGWIDAAFLNVGDLLVTPDGTTVPVEAIETEQRDEADVETVYNFHVETHHNYYVHAGDLLVLVHNAGHVPKVTFSRAKGPGLGKNFDNAVAAGEPTRLTKVSAAARDANRRAALRGQPPAPAGQSLDEYPFASSAEGGAGSHVMAVPRAEQNYQGGVLSAFYQKHKIQPGDQFDVEFVP